MSNPPTTATLATARKVLGDKYSPGTKTEIDVKREAVEHHLGAHVAGGKSDTYVNTAFGMIGEHLRGAADASAVLATPARSDSADKVVQFRTDGTAPTRQAFDRMEAGLAERTAIEQAVRRADSGVALSPLDAARVAAVSPRERYIHELNHPTAKGAAA